MPALTLPTHHWRPIDAPPLAPMPDVCGLLLPNPLDCVRPEAPVSEPVLAVPVAVTPLPILIPLPQDVLALLNALETQDGLRVGLAPLRDETTGRIVGARVCTVAREAIPPHSRDWCTMQRLAGGDATDATLAALREHEGDDSVDVGEAA